MRKNWKMGDLSNFEREQITGASLAGASVVKTAILLGVSRVTVSKVMSVNMNHGKITSTKRNSGQKSTLTERDHHILRRISLKNHRTSAAQVTAERNIHLGDPVSTKTVQHKLHKYNTYPL
jgi:IS30 family transposase